MNEDIKAHLERAEELLGVAEELADHRHPADSISRSYYAVFHSAQAVLQKQGIERKSHHAVWSAFGEFVTNRGLIDPKYHKYALRLFASRLDCDYLPKPSDTGEKAREYFILAGEFVAACREFIAKKES